MAHNVYGEKVLELCLRRGMSQKGAQTELAGKLEAIGYGKAFGIKHVKHHLNYALQRNNANAITVALNGAIINGLELDEAEKWELHQAGRAGGRQAMRDERVRMQEKRERRSIQCGSEAHDGLIPFYA